MWSHFFVEWKNKAKAFPCCTFFCCGTLFTGAINFLREDLEFSFCKRKMQHHTNMLMCIITSSSNTHLFYPRLSLWSIVPPLSHSFPFSLSKHRNLSLSLSLPSCISIKAVNFAMSLKRILLNPTTR